MRACTKEEVENSLDSIHKPFWKLLCATVEPHMGSCRVIVSIPLGLGQNITYLICDLSKVTVYNCSSCLDSFELNSAGKQCNSTGLHQSDPIPELQRNPVSCAAPLQ